jgi:hypothetical protein
MEKAITPQQVIDALLVAANEHGMELTEEMLRSRSRMYHIAVTRQLAMFIMYRHLNHFLSQIGRYVGRDHSTIIYGVGVIESRIEVDAAVANLYKRACDLLDIDTKDIRMAKHRVRMLVKKKQKKDTGYYRPKNWTAEEKAKIAEVKRNGGFSPFSL